MVKVHNGGDHTTKVIIILVIKCLGYYYYLGWHLFVGWVFPLLLFLLTVRGIFGAVVLFVFGFVVVFYSTVEGLCRKVLWIFVEGLASF